MRATHRITVLVVGILGLAALLLMRAEPTKSFPHLRFVLVDVRVVDATTARPVVDAMVYPYCLGGTPYATNSYRTDTNGFARFMAFERFAAVRVTMAGYQEASLAFVSTNGVFTNCLVTLKRVEK